MNLPASKGLLITTGLAMLTIATGLKPSQAQSNRASDLTNGVYVYGQTHQPNQIDQGYVVFQHNNGKVVGAAYYPNSEFECFQGRLNNTKLEIQPISTEGRTTANLNNFHQVPTSQNDRRILSQCQQEVRAAKVSLQR